MIHIHYIGENLALKAAIACVNHLFVYTPFLTIIHAHKEFDMATVSPQKIANMIENTDLELSVHLYTPSSYRKHGYAYDNPLDQDTLYLNALALNRPVHSLCNTLVHQCVHALNDSQPRVYFGHGNNKPEGKTYTAPYWIANQAQKMIAKDDSIFEPMQHETAENMLAAHERQVSLTQPFMYEPEIFCVYDVMSIMEMELQ